MATNRTVNNQTYLIPDQGDSPSWGEEVSGWIGEVTDLLNDIQSPDDIIQSTFTVANNQTTPTNITGLAFNTSRVRSVEISYNVYRTTAAPLEVAESGIIYAVYKNIANSWEWNIEKAGDAGISFNITNSGQVQYTTNNMSGASYYGKMVFRAKTLQQ